MLVVGNFFHLQCIFLNLDSIICSHLENFCSLSLMLTVSAYPTQLICILVNPCPVLPHNEFLSRLQYKSQGLKYSQESKIVSDKRKSSRTFKKTLRSLTWKKTLKSFFCCNFYIYLPSKNLMCLNYTTIRTGMFLKNKNVSSKSHVIYKNVTNWIYVRKCIFHGFMMQKLIS